MGFKLNKDNFDFGEGTGSSPNKLGKVLKFLGKRVLGPASIALEAYNVHRNLTKPSEIIKGPVDPNDPRNKNNNKKKELSEEEKRKRHNNAMKNKKSTL
tara:strand:- start:1619 stop:1915 length:297 start_codon:yes stop_codon:yes gene_type:complete